MKNCVDIVRPFIVEAEALQIPIQTLGGLGSAALAEADTTFDSKDHLVVAANPIYVPQMRDNGSPRDLDVLVLSTDEGMVEKVEKIAEETIDGELEVNVFGLHKSEEIDYMTQNPFSKLAITAAVSDRYVIEGTSSKPSNGNYYKAVFPFGVVAPSASLETWHLINGDEPPVPIPHPTMMVLNNAMRSTAGLRSKYDQKIQIMTDNMLGHDPGLIEWIFDGPGQSHIALAGVLRALGWKKVFHEAPPIQLSAIYKDVAINPVDVKSLMDNEAFLLREAPVDQQKAALRLARLKSVVVGHVERHWQDKWEQLGLESHFKNIVRNKKS